MPEAFALVREAAKRTIGQRHFDVQLLGGIILAQGGIAEMRTGEGKTLVATLPLYLRALEKKGAHLITVNDYLARRDAEWMGQVYHSLGLSVGALNHEQAYLYQPNPGGRKTHAGSGEELKEASRQEAYAADITYGTNNEFGFDFLRDNLAYSIDQVVQARHDPVSKKRQTDLHYAIIDEVDSILIDEARTPLIISAPAEESADLYRHLARIVEKLVVEKDYIIDEKMKAATLTEGGQEKIIDLLHEDPWEMSASLDNLETRSRGFELDHHITAALRAKALFKKDKDYVVRDNEIIIVDEFTGRLMVGRRYSEGLHQAIEAKEGVEVKKESKTLATITFQNYFKMYHQLAGMTGTAETEAEEFYKIYNLEVTTIPTNQPMVRQDLMDRIYATEVGKFQAVALEVKERFQKGQPVLIGTTSVEKNEFMSKLLEKEGVPHEMLNAKNHEREAQILSDAGRYQAVTVATNMAGRGVDIMLGGVKPNEQEAESEGTVEAWQASRKKVIESGGLHVIGTERHEARRIDNQLRGRAGRQGDPGSSQFFVSAEDDLMRIFGGDRIKRMMQTFNLPEDKPIENNILSRSIEQAQKKVEGHNFDARKHILDYDNVLAKHRQAIYRQRKEILEKDKAEEIKKQLFEMVEEEIEAVLVTHTISDSEQNWDLNKIGQTCSSIFSLPVGWQKDFEEIRQKAGSREQDVQARTSLFQYLLEMAEKSIIVLEEKNEKENFWRAVKFLLLKTMDYFWEEHLKDMDNLKGGIGLRGYGQRDPLVEYKKEAYFKYHRLLDDIRRSVVQTIFKINIEKNETKEKDQRSIKDRQKIRYNLQSSEKDQGQTTYNLQPQNSNLRKGVKVGRNSPCPCGAKKPDGTSVKYKHCCGR